jgi:hypothetical protein
MMSPASPDVIIGHDSPWRRLFEDLSVTWGEVRPSPASRSVVVVLGNAYGLMAYQEPLARTLGDAGFNAVWTSLPGQEGAKGAFGLDEVVEFIRELTADVASRKWQVAFIAHCASATCLLEAWRRYSPPNVRCVIVYGPLINLADRKEAALNRLTQVGVTFNLPDSVWTIDLASLMAQFPHPLLLAHSEDPVNRRRATPDQVKDLASASSRRLLLLKSGYDNDITRLADFVPEYIAFLQQNLAFLGASKDADIPNP